MKGQYPDNNYEFSEKEFPLTTKNFEFIKRIAYEKTGIKLSDHKRNMIYSRLARRLRELRLPDFDTYCDMLLIEGNPELGRFINAITTNLTAFFREGHHFEFIRTNLAADLRKKVMTGQRIRVWSCACSTGEEPYSIAMTLKALLPGNKADLKILATDLDTNVVKKGRDGIYAKDRIAGLDPALCKRWFLQNHSNGTVRVKDEIREMITFNPLNLLHDWPMKGPFDFIFCRNVVIYFDKETQKKLFDKIAGMLTPNGYLFIGHSENLNGVSTRFKGLGRTIYQRVK